MLSRRFGLELRLHSELSSMLAVNSDKFKAGCNQSLVANDYHLYFRGLWIIRIVNVSNAIDDLWNTFASSKLLPTWMIVLVLNVGPHILCCNFFRTAWFPQCSFSGSYSSKSL